MEAQAFWAAKRGHEVISIALPPLPEGTVLPPEMKIEYGNYLEAGIGGRIGAYQRRQVLAYWLLQSDLEGNAGYYAQTHELSGEESHDHP